MKKNIIIAIVVVLAVIGVGVAVKFSQGSVSLEQTGPQSNQTEDENPASKIGEGEVKITQANFDQEVKNYKGVVLVDMFSPTCPHCQVMGPIVSEIAKETQGKYKVGKLNVLLENDIATEFKIESVPAFIVFKDGQEVGRIIGETTKEKLLEKLAEAAK